jgi:hypothetical protein
MPNLPTHVDLAWSAAESLSHPLLKTETGSYLLGATAPDVRILTKRPRVETHFFDLNSGSMGDGMAGLFEACPELRSPTSDAQAAFVAGYLTHLVADETWIVSMYRPHFGGTGGFGSPDAANLYDRAAQLTLDRACEERVRSLLPVINGVDDDFAAGPLDAGIVGDWRRWVVDFLAGERPYAWERLRHMADRISGRDPGHRSHEIAEQFLSDVPTGLRTLYGVLSESEFVSYMDRARCNIECVVLDYLAVADEHSVTAVGDGRRLGL